MHYFGSLPYHSGFGSKCGFELFDKYEIQTGLFAVERLDPVMSGDYLPSNVSRLGLEVIKHFSCST